ncbi:CopG family ribbon-helix-helix protein [Thermohalobacter berrensis]|uniref:CopG family transcriptional regulator n=1 Tax=Thermohalobacter berrensis TaxID=99594 RepID=A0A419SY11_9FIRM|nr:ribbon-helix-helix protein, CopG family [Thermohalobacter berrensis]RKD30071.1 CopG family transcriptional regulator [Thermohalobacter berrensis]
MAELKKIMVSLPDNLLREIDGIIAKEKKDRNEFIREAMKLYLREKKRIQTLEKMKNGYLEMSEINASLAEMGLEEDTKELSVYEAKLTGSE